uniref:SGNH hydrolase-type esterase domain-containing protein n=1 Tax=Trieres chinensis TaxID=1514140 RepID=A0A7S2EHH7_TRICV
MLPAMTTLRSGDYYENYHGHWPEHLAAVDEALRSNGKKRVFFVGDSTLDNKHWFFDLTREKGPQVGESNDFTAPCLPSYRGAFVAGHDRMVKDVAYHTTSSLEGMGVPYAALNCAVEESTVGERRDGSPYGQDDFVRGAMTSDDYLAVSMGGNDIALKPTVGVIAEMALVTRFASDGWLSPLYRAGLWSLTRRFASGTERYLRRMMAEGEGAEGGNRRPRGILVCALYYPCERGSGWADPTLRVIGYDDDPDPVQGIIRSVWDGVAETVAAKFPDVPVRQVKFYEALDPKDARDYEKRVEPSVRGGAKMGRVIAEAIRDMEEKKKGEYVR